MEHSACHIYSKHFNPNWVTPLPSIVLKEIKRKHLLSRERRRGLRLWTVPTTEMLRFHTTEGAISPTMPFPIPICTGNPSIANGLTANLPYCLHLIFIYSKLHLLCVHMCACVCICMVTTTCHSVHVEVRKQLAGTGSFLSLSRSQTLNSGCQEWHHMVCEKVAYYLKTLRVAIHTYNTSTWKEDPL